MEASNNISPPRKRIANALYRPSRETRRNVLRFAELGRGVLRPTGLGDYRIGLFGVDTQVFYGFGYDAGLDFAVLLQLVQRG